MRPTFIRWVCCPACRADLELKDPAFDPAGEVLSGLLGCSGCRQQYPVVDGVPWLLTPDFFNHQRTSAPNTARRYGYLWEHSRHAYEPQGVRHAERVCDFLGEEVFQGKAGIDAGSGMGDDTEYLLRRFPAMTLISLDISLGVNSTYQKVKHLQNAHVARASVLQLPLKDQSVDFIYSYGVLHHTSNPQGGFNEFCRVIRKEGRVILYLYEDHARNYVKRMAIRLTSVIRKITVRIPPPILHAFCRFLSPLVVVLFSWPARLLRRFSKSCPFAEKMPFNFGTSLGSLTGDLYDRFSAPQEYRFSKEAVREWYRQGGLRDIQVDHFPDIAGLVSSGRKR